MDFGFTEQQRELYAEMTALAEATTALPAEARMARLAEGGVLGLALAREHGGRGLDLVSTAHAFEALGAGLDDGGLLLAAGAHLFGVALTLARAGGPELSAAWLPRLARGEVVATIGATERGAGSDVSRVETTLEAAADGLFVTGHKRYVTYADRAGLVLVLAREPEGEAVTTCLVERPSPGLSVGAPLATAGLAGARLAPLSLARVPVAGVVGRRGAGRSVFQLAMTFERALILAFRVGAMKTALEAAVSFARAREVGGGSIARHQAVAHRVARMKLRLETSRLMLYKAAWLLDRGERAQAEAALTKWHVADSALASALDAAQLRGGEGFLEETGLPGGVDDALGATLHSGTQDVLATVVARWLGLAG